MDDILLAELEALRRLKNALEIYWPNVVDICLCNSPMDQDQLNGRPCDFCAVGKALTALKGLQNETP